MFGMNINISKGLVLKFLWVVIYDMYSLVFAVSSIPFIFFLSFAFFIEHIFWCIFHPILNKIISKRKLISLKDLKISLVIPNWNGKDLLKECLLSIFTAEGFREGKSEVIVVDDASTDDSVNFIKSNFPQARLILNKKNKGFGFTCNRGIKEAKNELIILINNDIIVTENFLKPLINHFQDEDVFAVTPKLYGWDRKTFMEGMNFGHFRYGYIRLCNEAKTENRDRICEPSPSIYAIGGAIVFRKRDFLWLGGFDDIYRPNCWEDIDISYRAWKRGLKVIYEPNSILYHKGKATLTYERHKEIKNELSFMWKNITDKWFLIEHLLMLPWHLYKGKLIFLRGFLWAFRYLPKILVHRLMERRFAKVEDKDIFDSITLYYRNFVKINFVHLQMESQEKILLTL